MVSVVVATAPFVTLTVDGLNEQTGEGSAAGVIELQPGVTMPLYPLVGVMLRMALAPLPAVTLVGFMVVCTAMA